MTKQNKDLSGVGAIRARGHITFINLQYIKNLFFTLCCILSDLALMRPINHRMKFVLYLDLIH
jgi:hypothetical protein